MKKILFLCLMHAALSSYECPLPKYDGHGPRNVYYLTGAGDRLFAGWEIWGNQDGWSEPYITLRDAYVSQGYKLFTSLPEKIDNQF